MSQKVCYLLTSQEKSPPQPGNGSCNMDSDTNTGKNIAAILKPKTGSYSHLEILSLAALADISENQTSEQGSGTAGATAIGTPNWSASMDLTPYWLKILYPHIKQVTLRKRSRCLEQRCIPAMCTASGTGLIGPWCSGWMLTRGVVARRPLRGLQAL